MPFEFQFHELLIGTYHLFEKPFEERNVRLTIAARVSGVRNFARNKSAQLTGEITLDQLAAASSIEGTLRLDFTQQYRIPYDIAFRGDDGKRYRFYGERDLRLVNLPDAIAILPGGIYDENGTEIGRTILRGDLSRDVLESLRSFRFAFGWRSKSDSNEASR